MDIEQRAARAHLYPAEAPVHRREHLAPEEEYPGRVLLQYSLETAIELLTPSPVRLLPRLVQEFVHPGIAVRKEIQPPSYLRRIVKFLTIIRVFPGRHIY